MMPCCASASATASPSVRASPPLLAVDGEPVTSRSGRLDWVAGPERDAWRRVIGITIAGREAVDPRGWERTWGVAAGVAGPDDGVVGLDREQPWTADFEVIGPAGDAGGVAVLVDVENRGGRSTHGMIGPELARRPARVRAGPVADRSRRRSARARPGRRARHPARVRALAAGTLPGAGARRRQPVGLVREHVRRRGLQRGPGLGHRRVRRRLRLPVGRQLAGDEPVG